MKQVDSSFNFFSISYQKFELIKLDYVGSNRIQLDQLRFFRKYNLKGVVFSTLLVVLEFLNPVWHGGGGHFYPLLLYELDFVS